MNITNPAGFTNRFIAGIVDAIILVLFTGTLTYFLYGVFFDNDHSYLTDSIGFFYHLLLPVFWSGYTIGRRIVGNRIVRIDGKKVGIGTMVLRDVVGGAFYLLTFGIGLIVSACMVGLREDKRAIHDFIARTYVTIEPPAKY